MLSEITTAPLHVETKANLVRDVASRYLTAAATAVTTSQSFSGARSRVIIQFQMLI